MFIPLKDSALRLNPPYITIPFIMINVGVFIYQPALPLEALQSWIYSTGLQQQGGVTWFAHIGGFLAGIALLFTLEPYERKQVWKQLNRKY